ncbi:MULTISPECIES: SemiSWEET transporter [Lactococcus]|uniref:SemiSWEET transporter n=1 Tax=Lactococcus TaxID=1357 RepID=UPI0007AE4BB4|nr:SemiSWEET transporter [Lactococcus cremoris]
MIIIGLIAGGLTSISFIPQAVKTIRTKNTSSISIATYILFTIGVALWVIYGYFLKDFAILMTNLVTIVPSLIILLMKIRSGKKQLK